MKLSQEINEVSQNEAEVSGTNGTGRLKGNVPLSQSHWSGTNRADVSQSMGGPEGPPDMNSGGAHVSPGTLRPLRASASQPPRKPLFGEGRKFDGWLAGASAEQQARWERMQAGAKVEDETLPPALRGGALGAF